MHLPWNPSIVIRIKFLQVGPIFNYNISNYVSKPIAGGKILERMKQNYRQVPCPECIVFFEPTV